MLSKFLLSIFILLTVQLPAQITAYTVCLDDFCDGYGLENLSLEITSMIASPVIISQYAFTDISGCATFSTAAIPADTLVVIPGDGGLDPLNGINTYDFLVFQKHLTGEQPFTEIYQWIAADVNLDRVVDSTDYTILQNFVTGISNELPKGQFRVFPKTFVFAHPATPLEDSIPDDVLKFVNGSPADLDLWSVQLGKISRTGCLASSAVADTQTPLPVKIFPNPATETLFIRTGGIPSVKIYTLTDISGRSVYECCTNGAGIDIPVVGLSKGMYILNIREDKLLVYTEKVIISR